MDFCCIKSSEGSVNAPAYNSLRKIKVISVTVIGWTQGMLSHDRFVSGIIGTAFEKLIGEIRPVAVRIQRVRGVFK